MRKSIQPVIITALCLLVIFLLFKIDKIKHQSIGVSTREKSGVYKFTNPILDFELSQEFSSSVIPIGSAKNYIEDIKEDLDISHISVYFRDLNNGQWIGIEEKEYFSPASMLKTPLLIAFLRWAQDDPSVLNKKVIVTDNDIRANIKQNIEVKNTAILGQTYTLFELANKMIQESDNVSAKIIYENIPKNYVQDVFSSIGLDIKIDSQDSLIRVKDIAAFFRILYNASYLDRKYSEQALSLLSGTSYNNGIVSGVPQQIMVAHKFGERSSSGILLQKGLIDEKQVQLHDCGIVYYPSKPYIICIMTRGHNLDNQQKAISYISKFFYGYLEKNNN